MKNNRLSPVPSKPLANLSPVRWFSRWNTFWFEAIDPSGLHWLRVFAGILFLAWILPFMGHETEFFGLAGWADRQTYQDMRQLPGGPPVPLGWSLFFPVGQNASLVHAIYWSAVAVFVLFTLGIATRITSALTWVCVVSSVSNPAASFDADFLLIILAFYLMIGYWLCGLWSSEKRSLGALLGNNFLTPLRKPDRPILSHGANLALRLFQVHFAIIVFTSCLHKLQFGHWWGGVALWYPLHNPFTMNAERLRIESQNAESILIVLGVAQYIMLAWQLTFTFFAWKPHWRWLLVSGGVVAWIGSAFVYGEPLFGPFYMIGCLSYLSPREWQALTNRFTFSRVQLRVASQQPALVKNAK